MPITLVRKPSLQLWRVLILFIMAVLLLVLTACASWQTPAAFDDSTLRARAETDEINGVRLKATVLSSEESQQMFGFNVNEKNMMPVWIEVENTTDQTLWLLRAGTDPDYFSPLEVAWGYHKSFSGESNDKIDEHFHQLSFENPIASGVTKSGIIFANPHHEVMLLNVDLLGNEELFPFTLFPEVPDDERDEKAAEVMHRFTSIEVVDDPQKDEFRAAVRQLPCCGMTGDSISAGDPFNVVIVGEFEDIAAAVVRRGYRRTESAFDFSQKAFDREPDFVIRKAGQGDVPSNWLRLWLAPLRYQGQPVFLGQAGRPVGGRFIVLTEKNLKLHPNVDEVRNMLIGDFLYSGGLAKLGFEIGSGTTIPVSEHQEDSLNYADYQTDGLRVVMFMVTRPLSLEDVQILDWVPHIKNIEVDAMKKNGNTQH